ncbi:uncharacterized protein ASPGLDRAFT_987945 [Aspergillus glaucus CBS 516.65]|uniref:Fucose-specific lectin n=1 Tax=Aspergillus glaucus CBS 516.65 TaxID=1160497 RepID=A0A1L9VUY8_ASPGL|nr:hypothetical protein ASPGLDRAFT_987945 [Aspergillus glaucus CBS 516.65]OJJ87732.1 hypothetical protein ASPGLDRAFT_987945 [Aspergillus glaucus CBS 516.65]
MSGVAAVKTPSHDDIQVFFTTTKSSLGLDIRKTIHQGENFTKHFKPTDGEPTGNVLGTSDIAVSTYSGIQFVVGITGNSAAPGNAGGAGAPTTDNNIAILSPINQTIARVEDNNTRITSCSNGTKSSVFFLGNDPNNTTVGQLREYDFDTKKVDTIRRVGNIVKGSGLASYYTKDDRLVVYQDIEGALREYSSKITNNLVIDNTKNSGARTPLAVAYDSQFNKTYVYYSDKEGDVYFVVKDQGNWKQPSRLPNNLNIPDGHQITVARSDNLNHLFWVSARLRVEHWRHNADQASEGS